MDGAWFHGAGALPPPSRGHRLARDRRGAVHHGRRRAGGQGRRAGSAVAACIALGAIVSPPDAVSARAVLQRVTLPRRLATLLEGESLLNDATGLVLFRFAVAATLTGTFSLGEAVGSFTLLVGGGLLVGRGDRRALGARAAPPRRRLPDDRGLGTRLLGELSRGRTPPRVGRHRHGDGRLVCGWYQHTVFTRACGCAAWRSGRC